MINKKAIIRHAVVLAVCMIAGITVAFSWYGRTIQEANSMNYNDSLYINGNESFSVTTYYSNSEDAIRGDLTGNEITNLADAPGGSVNSALAPGGNVFFRTVLTRTGGSVSAIDKTYVTINAKNITYTNTLHNYLTLGVAPMKPLSDFTAVVGTITSFPLVDNFEITDNTVSIYWYLHLSEKYTGTTSGLTFSIGQLELLYN